MVYQIGYIASICGLIIFVLADFGYGLFGKCRNKESVPGLVTSIIMLFLVIFIAEYLCISYEIFDVYKDAIEITFFDAVRATPDFLAEREIFQAFVLDLTYSYAFGFLAIINSIIRIVKARRSKTQKAM